MSGPAVLRRYRDRMGSRFDSFTASYKETDLWIGVDPASRSGNATRMEDFAASRARAYRLELEAYIARRPEFLASLVPLEADPEAPPIAAAMLAASALAGVGPMAAVAGAVAGSIGADLEAEFDCREIIVENGGDVWLRFEEPIDLAVFAGSSPLSERVGVSIPPSISPLAVCTSSGTVGPSLSFGLADATMIAARWAPRDGGSVAGAGSGVAGRREAALVGALADAWATAVGNAVSGPEDIDAALGLIEGALGEAEARIVSVLVIKDDRMGIRGLLPLKLFSVTKLR